MGRLLVSQQPSQMAERSLALVALDLLAFRGLHLILDHLDR